MQMCVRYLRNSMKWNEIELSWMELNWISIRVPVIFVWLRRKRRRSVRVFLCFWWRRDVPSPDVPAPPSPPLPSSSSAPENPVPFVIQIFKNIQKYSKIFKNYSKINQISNNIKYKNIESDFPHQYNRVDAWILNSNAIQCNWIQLIQFSPVIASGAALPTAAAALGTAAEESAAAGAAAVSAKSIKVKSFQLNHFS